MTKEDVTQLISKIGKLRERRELWEPIWQEVTDFVLPRLSDWSQDYRTGPKKYGIKAFDGAAKGALRLASDGLQGYLTPRTAVWFRNVLRPDDLMDLPGVRSWAEEAEEQMYAALNRSNFYDQIGEVFDTGLSIGTATMFIEEDVARERIHFSARHPREVYVAEDRYGNVDTWIRDYWMSGKKLLEEFGEKTLSQHTGGIVQQIKENPFRQWRVYHMVMPRDKRLFGKIDSKNKPIASVYILHEQQIVLREGGYDRMPAITWRYRTSPGEEYGTSPGIDSLIDVVRANEVSRTNMAARQLAIEPPIAYPQNMRGKLNIQPRGMNPYVNPAHIPQPINVLGQYPFGVEQEQILREQIRQHFNADFFLLLSQQQAQGRTATEVMEMAGERAAVMGATVGRVESELLDPILSLVFEMEYEAGRIPPAPDELMEESPEVQFDYVGPLAQIQKKHYGQQTVIQTLSQAMPIMDVFPEVRDIVNADELFKKIITSGGFVADAIRSDREVAELRQQRAEMEQQMMAAEQEQQAAQTYKDTKDAPQAGSPAEALARRMSQ